MVYFPEHRLLYASNTLVMDPGQHPLYQAVRDPNGSGVRPERMSATVRHAAATPQGSARPDAGNPADCPKMAFEFPILVPASNATERHEGERQHENA